MNLLPGVYIARKKDGLTYYRSSITSRGKHISLGSFPTNELAHMAYKEATYIIGSNTTLDDYDERNSTMDFNKWVVLINYRDNKIYIKNPIYIKNKYFLYYLNKELILKFDVDDLFFYSTHKIMKRNGHLFVADYGMQISILSRYGVKNYAVAGRDYQFVNGDHTDFRYGNIEIINKYHGVHKIYKNGLPLYITKIHLNGDYIVGKYASEAEAAIAYNKAVKILNQNGVIKNFPMNYVLEIDAIEYAKLCNMVKISKKVRFYTFSPNM